MDAEKYIIFFEKRQQRQQQYSRTAQNVSVSKVKMQKMNFRLLKNNRSTRKAEKKRGI